MEPQLNIYGLPVIRIAGDRLHCQR